MTTRTHSRQVRLAKIHIAKKQLGLDEESYHAVLIRHGAQPQTPSSRDLTIAQMDAVLREFTGKGWIPRPSNRSPEKSTPDKLQRDKPQRRLSQDDEIRKIRALWLFLHSAGVVLNPEESALARYAKRMAGIDDLHWADGRQCHRLIETLKAWGVRTLPGVLVARIESMQALGLIDDRFPAKIMLDRLLAHPTRRPDTFEALRRAFEHLDELKLKRMPDHQA